MVSLLGYPIDIYANSIIATYVLLLLLAIVRLITERFQGEPLWMWKGDVRTPWKGTWKEYKKQKYLWIVPLVAMPILFLIYMTQVRIGFVMAVNGIVVTLILGEVANGVFRRW